jgi:hypothetical protein
VSRRAGQAWHWCRRIVGFVILGVLLLAGGAAWRLAQGPVDLPMLARAIERAAAEAGGVRVTIGSAAIAWEGWREGSGAPLDIRLEAVRLIDMAGGVRAELPEAAVTLSLRALLLGRFAPATIELRRPVLLVTRESDGGISLGAGLGLADVEAARPASAADGTPLANLLDALHRTSRGTVAEAPAGMLASFRRLRVLDGRVLVQDRPLDRRWALDAASIEIRRSALGGLTAQGSATASAEGLRVPVRLSATMPEAEPPRLDAELVLPVLRPAELAVFWPEARPLRLLDAAVTLGATASFGTAGAPIRAEGRLLAGPGQLDFGAGRRLPFAGFGATLTADAGRFGLTDATLRLPGPAGPVLQASGEARPGPEGWTADLSVHLPALSLASLPGLWPESLAPATRGPALAALSAGRLRDLKLALGVTAGPDFADLALREARLDVALDQASLAIGAAAEMAGAKGLDPSARIVAEHLGIVAQATPVSVTVETLRLRLPAPGEGAPATAITATAAARRAAPGEAWQGEAELGLDAVRIADLSQLWPAGLAAQGRGWITANLTAGILRNGRWRAEGVLSPGAGGPDIKALSGTAEIEDATVHWLRPIPPVQGVSGTASFSLPEIAIRTRGGRQLVDAPPAAAEPLRQARGRASGAPPRLGPGLDLRDGMIRLTGLDAGAQRAEIDIGLGGGLPEAMALLRHPRLHLFDRKPLEIAALAGQAEVKLAVGLPLLADIPVEQLRLRATGRVNDARLTEVLMGQGLDRAAFDVAADLDGLKLSGTGIMAEAPLRATLELDFRPGAASQVTERAQVSVPAANAAQLMLFGLDTAGLMSGTAAVEARYERRRNGQGSVALRGDLREARLAFDTVGWLKPVGAPGMAEATLRLNGDALIAAEGLSLDAGGLAATGRIGFGPNNRLERVEIAASSRLGITQFGGTVTRPARLGGPWVVALRGPVADLVPFLSGSESAPPGPRTTRTDSLAPAGPSFALDLRFARATTGEGRDVHDLAFVGDVDGHGMLRAARITGRTGSPANAQGGFALTLTPRGGERVLALTAADGGALLHALDLSDTISGGRLVVNGTYRELRPGAPLNGTAELDGFVVRNAPGLGKLLQAMTLFGVLEAMQGGSGLVFNRLIAPFHLTPERLELEEARAFSASLGLTAKGHMLRRERWVDMQGTVVPAYFFNQLLGNLPLIGRLFSPERGGGVFAATYRLRGPAADPTVTVNPLAAVTPGFLRGIFGLAENGRGVPVPNPTDR